MHLDPSGVALTRAEREEKLSTSFSRFVAATSAVPRQCPRKLGIALTSHEFRRLRRRNIGCTSP